MNLDVTIQSASCEPVPDEDDIRYWIRTTLQQQQRHDDAELTVRLVDIDEMTTLNQSYRGKSGPTNVLSFPAELPPELALPLLGDIVICAPVVIREAREQQKTAQAHWAHMTVHGTLHLLGYDHLEDEEAQQMEALETNILHSLNFDSPYQSGPMQSTQ